MRGLVRWALIVVLAAIMFGGCLMVVWLMIWQMIR